MRCVSFAGAQAGGKENEKGRVHCLLNATVTAAAFHFTSYLRGTYLERKFGLNHLPLFPENTCIPFMHVHDVFMKSVVLVYIVSRVSGRATVLDMSRASGRLFLDTIASLHALFSRGLVIFYLLPFSTFLSDHCSVGQASSAVSRQDSEGENGRGGGENRHEASSLIPSYIQDFEVYDICIYEVYIYV